MMSKSVLNICKIATVLCIVHGAIAGVVDNSVVAESRNVLNYMNTMLGVEDRSGRSMKSVDEQIFDRVAKYLKTNELRFELPETFFRKSEITFRADRGFDVKVSEEAANEVRKHKDDDIKKKLLLPALLLLKLKLKTILPIFMGIIGIKAMKALLISKLALTLVVGFIAYNLLKKPAAPAAGMETSTAASTYDPNSLEPSATIGGPYARIWDPSAHNLAYNYYSGSSSASNSASSSSATATSKPCTYSTL